MKERQTVDFDDILTELGELGRYQIFIYILICLPVLFAASNSLSYVFTAGIPNYRCFIPECEHASNTFYENDAVKWAIPQFQSNTVIGVKKDSCYRYKTLENVTDTCSQESFSNIIETCREWVFDGDERTIVSDWNITCIENQWKISLVGTMHFAGIIVGSCVFGILADQYGRKLIFVICIVIMSISGTLQVIAPEYVTFAVLIFVNALGTAGVYPLAFILGVEMVGKKKREITGIVLNYFYAIGEALVALIAWWTKDWVALQLIVSLPAIIFIVYYWFIPESVRWLLANQKNTQAEKIVSKMAKVNHVKLSDSVMNSFKENTPLKIEPGNDEHVDEETPFAMVKQVLRSKKLIIRFVIMYFIWAVNAFIYYGLSVNSTSLGGNKYLNFALVSLVEIPGYTIAWICIKKFGRKISLIGSLLLCGVTCTLTIFVNNSSNGTNWLVIILFLIGKFSVTSAFGVVYVYTAELLPTTIRSGGVGIASTFARVGALLAPFVPLLGLYYDPLPMILFGVVGIVAGVSAIKLPETLGVKLPETVDEATEI